MTVNKLHEEKRADAVSDDDYVMSEAEQNALETYYQVTRGETVEQRLDRLETKVDEINVKLATILESVDAIMVQAKPAIDQLVNSPLMKMITGGK